MVKKHVPSQGVAWEEIVPGQISRAVKAWDKNLMLVEVTFQEGAVGEMHRHPQEQASYCLSGEFDYCVEGEHYILRPGDTVHVGENQLHGCRLLTGKGAILDAFTPARLDFLGQSNS